jgi:transketolase
MRKEFSSWMESYGREHKEAVFLTGDLGFMALENVQSVMQERFINVGVAEQNMISVAAGLAQQALTPLCYSIAPFLIFRPFEQIRLDVCAHNMNVKLVGNGGGYGYGIMGATHHALEDLAVLTSLLNMKCYIPYCNEDVASVCQAMVSRIGPAYLRLGFGLAPKDLILHQKYAPIRRLMSGRGITIVGCGPVLLNAISAIAELGVPADVFAVSELPVSDWSEIGASIQHTKKLLVVEEHVRRGGVGEHLALWMVEHGLSARFSHRCAIGYPDNRYGSQLYHHQVCGLDQMSLQEVIRKLTHE